MSAAEHRGPLAGLRVVELAGQGPGPFAAMVLADLGADVVRVDRPPASGGLDPSKDILARSRRSVAVDIKDRRGVDVVLHLVEQADALIDPFRPGVLERLGLGPDVALDRNPRLVYARMTGWGQDGPYAERAGHDINYLAQSGVLGLFGEPGGPPVPPMNFVADFGGGAMFLAVGVLGGVLDARARGVGQVVDVAMVDGVALQAAMVWQLRALGSYTPARGSNVLDGGAPFYGVYETADGGHLGVGAMEPQFHRAFLDAVGLGDDADELLARRNDKGSWPEARRRIAEVVRLRTRDEWAAVFEGVDACATPVLSLDEALADPHLQHRGVYVDAFGVTQPAPAPRFTATPGRISAPPALPGGESREVLADWGMDADAVEELVAAGIVVEASSRSDHL